MRNFIKKRTRVNNPYPSSFMISISLTIDFIILMIIRFSLFLFLWVVLLKGFFLEPMYNSFLQYAEGYYSFEEDRINILSAIPAEIMISLLRAPSILSLFFIGLLVVFLSGLIYQIVSLRFFSRTIGHYITRIKVTRVNGQSLGVFRIIVRFLLSLIPIMLLLLCVLSAILKNSKLALLFLMLNIFWMEFNPFSSERVSIHDLILGVRVYKDNSRGVKVY